MHSLLIMWIYEEGASREFYFLYEEAETEILSNMTQVIRHMAEMGLESSSPSSKSNN